jgi:mannosyl-oligosaccharide glucosidase
LQPVLLDEGRFELLSQALQHYSQGGGPYVQAAKEAHTKLRSALVGNVVKQYQKTGYLWENYDDKDGHGRGSHPFTGWTALLVLA